MKVILGLGSGRCGTMTLTKLFDEQAGVKAEHETVGLYWVVQKRLFDTAWEKITEPDSIVANVSFAWLRYIPMACEKDPTVRCVCLKRDRTATVESFSAHLKKFNVWTHYTSPHFDMKYSRSMVRINGFPKYDLPREEAIGRYWDDYYRIADEWQERFPNNFKIFDLNSFNSEQGVASILDFAGIENPTVAVGIKSNERKAA
jgi:hypothetical protein